MRATVLVAAAASAMLACTSPLGSNTVSPTVPPSSPSPAASLKPSPVITTPSPSPTPVPSPPPTLNVAIVQSDYGALSAQTDAGASCSARVYLPNGHQMTGLRNPQTADANGTVSWTYAQSPTDPGTGDHVVDCSNGHLSGKAEWPFQVGA